MPSLLGPASSVPGLGAVLRRPDSGWSALVLCLTAALACGDDGSKAEAAPPTPACENPALRKLAESPVPRIDDWIVEGDLLYGASNSSPADAFHVLDLSDPNAIRELGSLDLEYGGPLLKLGKYIYLAGGLSNLQIIDVSDPAAPALAATFELPTDVPFDLWKQGDAVGVSSPDALWFLNVDDPLRPRVLGSLALGELYEPPAVDGDRLYAFSDPLSGDPALLRVVDVSNLQAPRLINSVQLPSAGYSTPVLMGDYAYLAGDRRQPTGTVSKLEILDLSDPSAPQPAGEVALNRSSSLLQDAGRLYVVSDRGVRVMDLTQPLEPKEVAHYANALLDPYFKIFDGHGYALVSDGLRQLDLTISCPE